jgi:hypothetical protein
MDIKHFENYFFVNQNCNYYPEYIKDRDFKEDDFADGYPFEQGLIPLDKCSQDWDNNWQIIEPSGQIYPIQKWQNRQKDSHDSFIQRYWVRQKNYPVKIQSIQKENNQLLIKYIPKVDGKDWEPIQEKFIFNDGRYIYEPEINLYPKD